VTDRRYYLALLLLLIYPYQNTLNLIIGFSLKPITYGLPFLLFIAIIFKRFKTSPAGSRFVLPLERYSLLDLTTAVIFLPLAMVISFTGALTGFITLYLGVFSFFLFSDLRINAKKRNILVLVLLASLLISVVYGVYEYLFAKFELVDWLVERSSHAFLEGDISEGYKRYSDIFYRSQSFELGFLPFGYQGFFLTTLLLGIVLLSNAFRGKIWIALAAVLSFLGLLSSVTLSAIAMCIGGYFYFLVHLRGLRRVKIIVVSICLLYGAVMAIMWDSDLLSVVELGLEVTSAKSKLEAHEEDNFDKADVIDNLVIARGTGTSSTSQQLFPKEMFIEHQYYATLAERGIIGLATYLLFMISLYLHLNAKKKKLDRGTFNYAIVVSLIWVWVFLIVVGFIHNSWGGNVDFMFMGLVGLMSNKFASDREGDEAAFA